MKEDPEDFFIQADDLLSNANINLALEHIISKASKLNLHNVVENAERLQQEYSLMLDYFHSGMDDPTRSEMLAQIYDKAYNLLSMIKKSKDGNQYKKISDIDINDRETLFDAIKNLFPATKEDRAAIQHIILDENLPLYLRGMVLSALTLNLITYFDNELFESLYIYTLEDQPSSIRARALFGMVLIIIANDGRIVKQPRIVEQIKLIHEENRIQFGDQSVSAICFIHTVLNNSLQVLDTQKEIKKDLTEKIYGVLQTLKNEPDISRENFATRWIDLMDNGGLNDKLQEIVKKQECGIDIMYDTFKTIANVSFFNHECNWLMPFDLELPEVKSISQKSKLRANYAQILNCAINMCDTDKFANIFIFERIPANDLRAIDDILKNNDIHIEKVNNPLSEELVHFSHDLYRFYTLSKVNKDYNWRYYYDRSFSFMDYKTFRKIITDPKDLRYMADNLMETEQWSRAKSTLQYLIDIEVSEKSLQQLAYCWKELGFGNFVNGELAILERCNTLYPGNKWTIKNYARVLHNQKLYSSEEELLRESCETFPDDTWFIAQLADCLIKQNKNNEALRLLYKADLIKENTYKTSKTFAECAINLKNKELAEKYIDQTLEFKKADPIDWGMGGIIALWNGDINLAVKRFTKIGSSILKSYSFTPNKIIQTANLCDIPTDTLTLALELARKVLNDKKKKRNKK